MSKRKSKSAAAGDVTSVGPSDIDLNFRPRYFWPLDIRTHVISSIKGAERKAYVKTMFEKGREGEIPGDVTMSGDGLQTPPRA
jgi:hypothetical protein